MNIQLLNCRPPQLGSRRKTSFLSWVSRRTVSLFHFHRAAQRALLTLPLLLCAGCFETKLSLESDEKAEVDAACLGKFTAQSGNERLTLIIRDLDHKHYLAIWTSTDGITSGNFVAHTSKIGDATFASLRRFSQKDGLATQQVILRADWSSDHNTVTLRHLKGMFLGQITTDRDFRRLVEQSINNPSLYESATTLAREVNALEAETADEISLAKKLLASSGDKTTSTSHPRSEDSLAVERYLRSRLIGGATEKQVVELSDAIANKFEAANLSPKDRAACITGTGEQRQILLYELKGEVWREEDRKYHDTAAQPLIVDIHRMIPRRAVFRDLFYKGNTSNYSPKKALPAIDEPIALEGKPPGSLAREYLEPLKSVIYNLPPLNKKPSESSLGFWMKVEKLDAPDVLYCQYQSEERGSWFQPVYFWYQTAPKDLEELLKTLPADHPIRLIGPARDSAPVSYVIAMQANQEVAALVKAEKGDLEKWRAAEAERNKKAGGGVLDYLAKMAELGMKLGQYEKEQERKHQERVQQIIAESGGKKIECPMCNGSGTVLDSTYNHQTNPYPLLSLEHGQFEKSREGVRIIPCARCSKTGVVDK